MISEYSIDKKINGFAPLGTASDWDITENGGKGSGNFGHSGRPGKQGGSAPANDTKTFAHAGENFTLAKRTEYEQAAYEQAAREYESEMGSYARQIKGYEESNASLERIKKANRPFEADPINLVITQNNRQIEHIKEQGRKAITKMAAKSAQFHYGVGEVKKENVGWSVKLGDTVKNYVRESSCKLFQNGAEDAYKNIALAETAVKKSSDGRYDVVYSGTDLGIGYSTYDRNNARNYTDGWNAAAKLTNEIRSNLLKTMPRYK